MSGGIASRQQGETTWPPSRSRHHRGHRRRRTLCRGCGRQFASKGLWCCSVACERQLHERNANTAILPGRGRDGAQQEIVGAPRCDDQAVPRGELPPLSGDLRTNGYGKTRPKSDLNASEAATSTRTGVQTDVDRRLHDPRPHIKARQSLSKRWSRSGHSSRMPAQIFRLRLIRRAAEERC
jgi:hypothetical protein